MIDGAYEVLSHCCSSCKREVVRCLGTRLAKERFSDGGTIHETVGKSTKNRTIQGRFCTNGYETLFGDRRGFWAMQDHR